MFILYLVCLILGGGLLGFSLFSGGDADTHSDGDLHLDGHTDFHALDVHSDVSDLAVSGDSHPVQYTDAADAVKFLSIRNAIYFTAFFGLTGTVFTALSFSAVISFLAAIGLGSFSAAFGYKLMKYLKSTESGESVSIHSLVGKRAVVVLPVSKIKRGKIVLEYSNQTIELMALLSENSEEDEFKPKDEVLIIEVKSNLVYIVKADF